MANPRVFESLQVSLSSTHHKPWVVGLFRSRLRMGVSWPRWISLICGGLALSACGVATFIVQQYDGEPISQERIAILRVNGGDPVRLEELDGEILAYELHERGSRVHIEMLPGEHELGLADGQGLPLKRRRFVAEAGKVYRPMVFRDPLAALPTMGDWAVAIYEVDRDSDHIIREISQVNPSTVSPTIEEARVTPNGATSSVSPGDAPPNQGTAQPPASNDVTPLGLPNTMVNPASPPTDTTTELRLQPLPSSVAPATGPEANPSPAEAVPMGPASVD